MLLHAALVDHRSLDGLRGNFEPPPQLTRSLSCPCPFFPPTVLGPLADSSPTIRASEPALCPPSTQSPSAAPAGAMLVVDLLRDALMATPQLQHCAPHSSAVCSPSPHCPSSSQSSHSPPRGWAWGAPHSLATPAASTPATDPSSCSSHRSSHRCTTSPSSPTPTPTSPYAWLWQPPAGATARRSTQQLLPPARLQRIERLASALSAEALAEVAAEFIAAAPTCPRPELPGLLAGLLQVQALCKEEEGEEERARKLDNAASELLSSPSAPRRRPRLVLSIWRAALPFVFPPPRSVAPLARIEPVVAFDPCCPIAFATGADDGSQCFSQASHSPDAASTATSSDEPDSRADWTCGELLEPPHPRRRSSCSSAALPQPRAQSAPALLPSPFLLPGSVPATTH